jgi:LEA14-like dessication related protein
LKNIRSLQVEAFLKNLNSQKRMKNLIIITLFFSVFLNSCDVLTQMDEMSRFSKCDFQIDNVDNFEVAGIRMDDKKTFADFNFSQAAQLTMALAREELDAEITVHLKATNPNSAKASMNALSWILLLDGQEMASGLLDRYIEIPANGGTTDIPVSIGFDLKKLFTGQSGNALMNLVSNIMGQGQEPSNLSMKLKPSIRVGSQSLAYPGFITIKNTVGK